MYSDGQSIQVSISSRSGKAQVIYAKPSSTTGMETHWEEAIQCIQPEKRNFKKSGDYGLDGDDSESELIAIPESDVSDSTLHGSVEDSFEENINESTCNITKPYNTIKTQDLETKLKNETYVSQIVRSSSKRSTWIIGSEETCDKKVTDNNKNCGKYNSSTSINLISNGSQYAKTVTTDSHRQVTSTANDTHHIGKPTPIGKHKKIIEPSITPVCTPVSDCDDCYKSNQAVLPPPSVERLLPIGARQPESPKELINFESQLEIPCQERLLPIGQHTKDISQLVDKVRQALGINAQLSTKSDNKKIDKYHHIRGEQPQQSHSHSPRKLIKQVALESPPNQLDAEDANQIFKTIKADNPSMFQLYNVQP